MSSNREIIEYCNKLMSQIITRLGDDAYLFVMCTDDNVFKMQYLNQNKDSINLNIAIKDKFIFDDLNQFLESGNFNGNSDVNIVVPNTKSAVYIMALLQMHLQLPIYPYHLMWDKENANC